MGNYTLVGIRKEVDGQTVVENMIDRGFRPEGLSVEGFREYVKEEGGRRVILYDPKVDKILVEYVEEFL